MAQDLYQKFNYFVFLLYITFFDNLFLQRTTQIIIPKKNLQYFYSIVNSSYAHDSLVLCIRFQANRGIF